MDDLHLTMNTTKLVPSTSVDSPAIIVSPSSSSCFDLQSNIVIDGVTK